MSRRTKQTASSISTDDVVASYGAAALGGRLRRLSDRIDREAQQTYDQYGVRFEQRWFGVLNLIITEGPMSVTDLAARLGLTHVAVSAVRSALEQEKLITAEDDPQDGRRRVLKLTGKGKALAGKLKPLWLALDQAAKQLNAEAGDALSTIERLEQALEKESLTSRVQSKLKK